MAAYAGAGDLLVQVADQLVIFGCVLSGVVGLVPVLLGLGAALGPHELLVVGVIGGDDGLGFQVPALARAGSWLVRRSRGRRRRGCARRGRAPARPGRCASRCAAAVRGGCSRRAKRRVRGRRRGLAAWPVVVLWSWVVSWALLVSGVSRVGVGGFAGSVICQVMP